MLTIHLSWAATIISPKKMKLEFSEWSLEEKQEVVSPQVFKSVCSGLNTYLWGLGLLILSLCPHQV